MLVAPILPHLTDSEEQLGALVCELAAAGATSVSGIALRLMSGTREWFFAWLRRERPDLVDTYERLYARGANPSRPYADQLQQRLASIVDRVALDSVEVSAPPRAGASTRNDQDRLF